MNQEHGIKSKKSSRLNPKKEQKIQIHIDSSWKASEIDISILQEEKMEQTPKVLKNYKIYYNTAGDIVASHLIERLKTDHFLRDQSSISFYDYARELFVYGFIVPKATYDMTACISKKFIQNKLLKIKVRSKKKIIIEALIDEQREQYEQGDEERNNKGQKEKKIGEVVEKVALWRKFYTGFYDQLGNYIQKPLESAAQEVGIAKKTLDDYLLQIRNGKKYGFNFNQKFNAKIGELRAFVRDEKKKQTGK